MLASSRLCSTLFFAALAGTVALVAASPATARANDEPAIIELASEPHGAAHVGASGYFFKLDTSVAPTTARDCAGVGFYPVNFGYDFVGAGVFSYVSMGGTLNVLLARGSDASTGAQKIAGAVAQARAALGVKVFPARALALRVELGYLPWSVGAVPAGQGQGDMLVAAVRSDVALRGDLGRVVDLSFGLDWL